ncbi:MAG: 8-oxoguanine glycosylase ogg1 [Marteilia pararefringens]
MNPKLLSVKVFCDNCEKVVEASEPAIVHLKKFLINYFSFGRYLELDCDTIFYSDNLLINGMELDNRSELRLLSQGVFENILSFICSANNNVKRISSMVRFISNRFGRSIAEYGGVEYKAFPSITDLSSVKDLEQILRDNKFGYRAKYVANAVNQLENLGGNAYLESLKFKSYSECNSELCKISGIGQKVADCICLMSLGKYDAVPIDTHMLNFAINHYSFTPKNKNTLSKCEYREVRSMFQKKWGKYAGIIQLFVFANLLNVY